MLSPKRSPDRYDEGLAEALALQAEFVAWRRSCSLQPTLADLRRLERWTWLAAEHGGVLFAAWAEQI